MKSYRKISYWLDKAVERSDEVWKILGMVDWEPARKHAMKLAYKEHIRLLKSNRNILSRPRSMAELSSDHMKGFCLIYAIGITQNLETMKEGDEVFYLNLKFTKKEGKMRVEKIGWDWAEEVF